MECLYRFHTPEEKLENQKLKKVNAFGEREMVPFATPCLATEGLKKVNMSGDEEQFVINVANSLKHPKFNAQIDGKSTISSLLVPIARQTGDKKTGDRAGQQIRTEFQPFRAVLRWGRWIARSLQEVDCPSGERAQRDVAPSAKAVRNYSIVGRIERLAVAVTSERPLHPIHPSHPSG